jgi:lysyl-tRNA synthetase class 2
VTEGFSAASKEDLEKKKVRVTLAGRVMSIRGMGRATFLHIADSRSRIQAYLKEDKVGKKNYKLFSLIDIGDFVSVEGALFKTKTGELTVFVDSFTFLAKCLHPLPEKWHGLQDVELRYRKRYLDLIMNPAERDVFRLRSAMISHIRKFFDEKGYVEVETPMMHSIPGGALARPFKTFHNALGIDLYLRIAPELYLKRLIVGGFEKVYEINRNFRNEGISSEHNPEFTMLEFYEAYSDYHDMMELTEELIHGLSLSLLGTEKIAFMGKKIPVKDRFDDRSGTIELASTLAPDKKGLSYGTALDIIFDKYVKQNLVEPTFVIDFPKEVSPLAKALKENPIANAFSELSDPAEQRRRFEQQAEARKKGDESAHLVDTDYIHALEYGLPPTGGEGIGIDRLVMIFADRKSIRDVILFPLLRPKKE